MGRSTLSVVAPLKRFVDWWDKREREVMCFVHATLPWNQPSTETSPDLWVEVNLSSFNWRVLSIVFQCQDKELRQHPSLLPNLAQQLFPLNPISVRLMHTFIIWLCCFVPSVFIAGSLNLIIFLTFQTCWVFFSCYQILFLRVLLALWNYCI